MPCENRKWDSGMFSKKSLHSLIDKETQSKWMTLLHLYHTFLNKCSSTVLNLAAVMAHSSGSYHSNTAAWAPSQCVCQRGEAMDFETLSFYKAISNSLQCLLDNPDTVHLPQQQGFWVSFQFSLFFMCRAFWRAQREWDSLFRYSESRKERPLLVVQDKNFWNCCNSAIITYSIFKPCWLHSKWTLIMLDSAAWEMAGRVYDGC